MVTFFLNVPLLVNCGLHISLRMAQVVKKKLIDSTKPDYLTIIKNSLTVIYS